MQQCITGALSFNGQRCTAIKVIFVAESLVSDFLEKLASSVSKVKCGLPFDSSSFVTPLPKQSQVQYLTDLLNDATSKGAAVTNSSTGGGSVHGLLMKPAIVFPVTANMRIWHEEQFGPIIPVIAYKTIDEVKDYIVKSPYGQQAAIFSDNPEFLGRMVDILSTSVSRININTQCGRSPDSFPFAGRKSSAQGTTSITEVIKAFSLETVVAHKDSAANDLQYTDILAFSDFLSPLPGLQTKA